MSERVLITGGAGFIGSHLADELLAHGYAVSALDNLSPQVHGPAAQRPPYLDDRVELHVGDVRDPAAVRAAVTGAERIVHLAAAVGVGQSMYRIREYTDVNNLGTAVLLEALAARRVKKLVVASSMSVYGEGRYRARDGSWYDYAQRSAEALGSGSWEPTRGGEPLEAVATPEHKQPAVSSFYALSKHDQERLCLLAGKAYGFPSVALRFFNTYGPRQALSNPYTGVLALFAARLLNDRPPTVFEDGNQMRDFVSVHDVARACRLALECDDADGEIVNVGSGQASTVHDVAKRLARLLGKPEISPEVTGKHRTGDIRHCFADITRARQLLGYSPSVNLDAGLRELAAWLRGQRPVDLSEQAREELDSRGLMS
jgi:dTDP-L-rhamnose 4-epimerase